MRIDPDGGEDDWVSKDGKNFYWEEIHGETGFATCFLLSFFHDFFVWKKKGTG